MTISSPPSAAFGRASSRACPRSPGIDCRSTNVSACGGPGEVGAAQEWLAGELRGGVDDLSARGQHLREALLRSITGSRVAEPPARALDERARSPARFLSPWSSRSFSWFS